MALPEIVTIAEVREWLRLTDDDCETALLESLIAAATEIVCRYADDWDKSGEVPAVLKLAVLRHIAHDYDNRGFAEYDDATWQKVARPYRGVAL